MMADDLRSTFYNVKDFAIPVLYKDKTIPALHVEDEGVFESDMRILSFIDNDVIGISLEDNMEIDGKQYQVSNFAPKDELKLEIIVSLSEV